MYIKYESSFSMHDNYQSIAQEFTDNVCLSTQILYDNCQPAG